MVGGALYYYANGSYYRNTESGYVVVNPPVGAVVYALPSGYSSYLINGVTYFYYGGVYYRRVSNGYLVVEDPTSSVASQPYSGEGKVMVTSGSLNVRTGPGKDNSVGGTVFSGNILKVIGNAPGWYYIEFADGSTGWVMAKFTTPLGQPADG
jgi:hypothetical protein